MLARRLLRAWLLAAVDGAPSNRLDEHVLDLVLVDLLALRSYGMPILRKYIVIPNVVFLLLPLDELLRHHQLVHLVLAHVADR